MSYPKNLKDLSEEELDELSEAVRQSIDNWISRGHKRAHLAIAESGRVYLDPDLVDLDAFNQAFADKDN